MIDLPDFDELEAAWERAGELAKLTAPKPVPTIRIFASCRFGDHHECPASWACGCHCHHDA